MLRVCRYVSIRFKKSLSDDDDVCSSCMHDRRSAKKTAVSIVYSNDEVSADLMWLTMFHTDGCQIDSNPGHSGYQLRRIQRVTTFATSYSPCTAERAIGNPNENPRRGVRDPRVIGKSQVNQPRLVRDPIGQPCRTTRRSLALHSMISMTSAPSSSRCGTTGSMVPFLLCTGSTTRRSAACLTAQSTSGMRLELARSLRHQHASWERFLRIDLRWTPSHCSSRF
jgi:hypothetical protein